MRATSQQNTRTIVFLIRDTPQQTSLVSHLASSVVDWFACLLWKGAKQDIELSATV